MITKRIIPCLDVRDGRVIQYIVPEFLPNPLFSRELETRVGLVKLIPGAGAEQLEFMLGRCRALIIESFGVGGLPHSRGMHELVSAAARAGKTVVMTTQVQNEGSDLAVYATGRPLAEDSAVLEAYDMTLEAAVTKLMWIMAQTKDPQRIKAMFYTTINHDILFQ